MSCKPEIERDDSPEDFMEREMFLKNWSVVKREKDPRDSYEHPIEGEVLEIVKQELTFREAMHLKRELNDKRTWDEQQKFYFQAIATIKLTKNGSVSFEGIKL